MKANLSGTLLVLRFAASAGLFVVAFGACRTEHQEAAEVASVRVSPVANPPPAVEGATSPAGVSTAVVRRPDDEPDAAPEDGRTSVTPGTQEADTDEAAREDALREQREARRRTEAELDKTLRGAFPKIRRCYEAAGSETDAAQFTFRLHRSGYVVDPRVSSGNSELDACIRGVLDNIRVPGVETDSLTFERTVQFETRAKQ